MGIISKLGRTRTSALKIAKGTSKKASSLGRSAMRGASKVSSLSRKATRGLDKIDSYTGGLGSALIDSRVPGLTDTVRAVGEVDTKVARDALLAKARTTATNEGVKLADSIRPVQKPIAFSSI